MTSAERKAKERRLRKELGQFRIDVWVPAAIAGAVKATIAAMVVEHKGETE